MIRRMKGQEEDDSESYEVENPEVGIERRKVMGEDMPRTISTLRDQHRNGFIFPAFERTMKD